MLTCTSKADDVDENTSDIGNIRPEVDAPSVPVPAILTCMIKVCDAIVSSSNYVVFRDLRIIIMRHDIRTFSLTLHYHDASDRAQENRVRRKI